MTAALNVTSPEEQTIDMVVGKVTVADRAIRQFTLCQPLPPEDVQERTRTEQILVYRKTGGRGYEPRAPQPDLTITVPEGITPGDIRPRDPIKMTISHSDCQEGLQKYLLLNLRTGIEYSF